MRKKPDPKGWVKAYYPILANDPSATADDVAACEHSLRKWQGLSLPVLRRYGLDHDSVPIDVDDTSCALCQRHYETTHNCDACPLAIVRDGVPCTDMAAGEDCDPYDAYTDPPHTPTPMIRWLKKALAYAKRQATTQKGGRPCKS